jgi:hypothetical protein
LLNPRWILNTNASDSRGAAKSISPDRELFHVADASQAAVG